MRREVPGAKRKERRTADPAFRVLRALFNYARAAYRPGNEPVLVENPCDILSQTQGLEPRFSAIGTHSERQDRSGMESSSDAPK